MKDLIRAGGFGPFYCEGQEFLQRIFVTVRDARWRETPPTQWECKVSQTTRSIEVAARHTSELVDFAWQGQLQLAADARSLTFEFTGEALRAMDICRLGLVVLHSVDVLIGARLIVRTAAGEHSTSVSPHIAAQAFVDGMPTAMTEPFSALKVDSPDHGQLELTFAGDWFELEDQRNWGDASFKTYCTPLRLGFPRRIEQGSRITHRVEALFTPRSPRTDRQRAAGDLSERLRGAKQAPKMGRVVCPALAKTDTTGWMRGWDHIQLDLSQLAVADIERLLGRLAPHVTVELRVKLGESSPLSTQQVAMLNAQAKRFSALILAHETQPVPSATEIRQLRARLATGPGAGIALLVSPSGYFVDINRGKELELEVDGVAFPVSSTVHGDDAQTILENSKAIADMIGTARRLTRTQRVAIAPLALYWPQQADSSRFRAETIVPWLMSVVGHACAAEVQSITLAEDVIEGLVHRD